jgi:ribose transport system permease protein
MSFVITGVASLVTNGNLIIAYSALGFALTFTVLAGIVVGGTSILGGSDAIWRTFMGVLFIAIIGNGFTLLAWNPLYEQITLGVILLLAVGGDAWSRLRTT